jgi:hypothetical protein
MGCTAHVPRLGRFSLEELIGLALLVVVLAFAAMRRDVIAEVLQPPYATPAPEGGPARQLVPGTP